ncbi:hypothetical protein CRG98_003175, partial [Punica granatum]
MAAVLKSRSSREIASLTVSQFRCFMANSYRTSSSNWDSFFTHSPYHFTSFKPVSLRGDFTEKGTQLLNDRKISLSSSGKRSDFVCDETGVSDYSSVTYGYDRNWSGNLGIVSSYGDPPEVWQPPGGGVTVRLGDSRTNPGKLGGGGSGGGGFDSSSKEGSWGGSNWGHNFPTPKEICKGLDKFVLSVAVYNHYKRIYHDSMQ